MPNHPNRGRGPGLGKNPKPAEIRKARLDAGLSQTAAAEFVYTSCRTWQQWEAEKGTPDHRRMHPAFFDLFERKVKEMK